MVNEKMNRKGRIVLRDLIFMAILFAGVMSLISIFVIDMSDEYSSNMSSEYIEAGGSVFGTNLMTSLNSSSAKFQTGTTDNIGAFQLATGVLIGAGKMLGEIVLLPVTLSSVISKMLEFMGVPMELSMIMIIIISILLYTLIGFVIFSALLKGGEI
jgi:hypothetical protein